MSSRAIAEAEVKTLASSDDRTDQSSAPLGSQQTDSVSQNAFTESSKQLYTTLAGLEARWQDLKKRISLSTDLMDELIAIVIDYLIAGNPERIKFFLERKLSPRISIPQALKSHHCRGRHGDAANVFDAIVLKSRRAGIVVLSEYPVYTLDCASKSIFWNGKLIGTASSSEIWTNTTDYVDAQVNARAARKALEYLRSQPNYFRYTLCESLEDYANVLRGCYLRRENASLSEAQRQANVEVRVASELADRTGALYQKFITILAHGRKDFSIQGTSGKEGNADTYTLSVYGFPLSAQPGRGATPAEADADAWEKAYQYVTQKIRELTFQEFVILENELASWR